MTTLLDLPTELIIQVLTSSPTVWTATCLSSVNKELRTIWLRHTNQILEGIVGPRVPAYEDAVDLANLQTSFLSKDLPIKRLQQDRRTTRLQSCISGASQRMRPSLPKRPTPGRSRGISTLSDSATKITQPTSFRKAPTTSSGSSYLCMSSRMRNSSAHCTRRSAQPHLST
jgi:hypothetical protein